MAKHELTKNNRLLKVRKALDLTQIEMANRIQTTQSNYSAIENGRQSLSKCQMLLLELLEGVNPSYLTGDSDQMLFDKPTIFRQLDLIGKGGPRPVKGLSSEQVVKAVRDRWSKDFGSINAEQTVSGYFLIGFIREALNNGN